MSQQVHGSRNAKSRNISQDGTEFQFISILQIAFRGSTFATQTSCIGVKRGFVNEEQ